MYLYLLIYLGRGTWRVISFPGGFFSFLFFFFSIRERCFFRQKKGMVERLMLTIILTGFDDLPSRLSRGGREGKKNEREVLWPVVISSPSPGGVDCIGVFLSLVLLILLCYYPSSFISGETLSCARRVSGMNGFEY